MRDKRVNSPARNSALGLRGRGRPLALALALGSYAGAVAAQGWGGSIGLASDTVYRGVSQTGQRPGWLADLHYASDSGWVGGLGATAERPQGQTPAAQLTAYLDRHWQLGSDWSAKIGVVHYDSPWNLYRNELRYNDLTAAVGYRGRWRLALAWSPDTPSYQRRGNVLPSRATTVELTLHQPLYRRLAAEFGAGHTRVERAVQKGYSYGSAGISYGIGDFYLFSSVIWSTAQAQPYYGGGAERTQWVTSVLWSF